MLAWPDPECSDDPLRASSGPHEPAPVGCLRRRAQGIVATLGIWPGKHVLGTFVLYSPNNCLIALIREGSLTAYRFGKVLRIRSDDFEKFVQERRIKRDEEK